MKEKILSLTAKDFEWEFVRGSGKGGQKKNKTSSAVRCQHKPSGAMGWAEDGRSQLHNRRTAFTRCTATKEFQRWLKLQIAKHNGEYIETLKKVEESMADENLLIEYGGSMKFAGEETK